MVQDEDRETDRQMENEHYIQTHTEQKHKVRRAVSIINNESELQNDGERRGNNNP